MEYMSIKGSVELKQSCLLKQLERDVLEPLEHIAFRNTDGIVTSKIKNARLWILGEGLMDIPEADRLIGIVNCIYGFADNTCTIDVQRVRWELHIILGHEYNKPTPAVCAIREVC